MVAQIEVESCGEARVWSSAPLAMRRAPTPSMRIELRSTFHFRYVYSHPPPFSTLSICSSSGSQHVEITLISQDIPSAMSLLHYLRYVVRIGDMCTAALMPCVNSYGGAVAAFIFVTLSLGAYQ